MIESVNVIGARGRVGSAVAARLAERGVSLRERGAELILLCVPDRVIVEVASTIAPGPWVAHVSGGTPLAALDPHGRRFSLHPLQTFTHDRGPEQLDGAWAAVTGETEEARAVANELAVLLGVRPFPLADDLRALYHAGAVIASNYLVTLRGMAGELLAEAAVPPEALDPLMRRVIDNDFQLTGPIERGDWETVERHRATVAETAPHLLAAYDDKGVIGSRIQVSVPDILVGESATTAMALIVHELATNSIKYGALSAEAGSLDVTCSAEDSETVLVWTERGGPGVSAPSQRSGFGSVLVKNTITRNLGGTIEFCWPPEGVIVTLRMNSARLGT